MEPRFLDQDDFKRMGLPKSMWDSDLSLVPRSVQPTIAKYVASVDEMIRNGFGFILLGPTGVGKTGIAACLAKAVRSHRHTVYFIANHDLKEYVRNRIQFDDDQSVLDRCKTVDLLVIDDLAAEDFKEEKDFKDAVFNIRALEALLVLRTSWKRATIFTTQLDFGQLDASFAGVMEILRPFSVSLAVTGPNFRVEQEKALKSKLLATK